MGRDSVEAAGERDAALEVERSEEVREREARTLIENILRANCNALLEDHPNPRSSSPERIYSRSAVYSISEDAKNLNSHVYEESKAEDSSFLLTIDKASDVLSSAGSHIRSHAVDRVNFVLQVERASRSCA